MTTNEERFPKFAQTLKEAIEEGEVELATEALEEDSCIIVLEYATIPAMHFGPFTYREALENADLVLESGRETATKVRIERLFDFTEERESVLAARAKRKHPTCRHFVTAWETPPIWEITPNLGTGVVTQHANCRDCGWALCRVFSRPEGQLKITPWEEE